jgi:hypothetical protein
VPIGDLVETGAQDVDDVPGDSGSELGFLEESRRIDEGIARAPHLTQEAPDGEPKEMGGDEGSAQGELLGGVVQPRAEAEMERRRGGLARWHGVASWQRMSLGRACRRRMGLGPKSDQSDRRTRGRSFAARRRSGAACLAIPLASRSSPRPW